VHDEHAVLPVSVPMHGEYGIEGVHLSTPAIIGVSGVEAVVPLRLNGEELAKLRDSGDALKELIEQVNI
jgi:L-lactate dehydrogenase